MTATLLLNLTDALPAEDLRGLVALADRENKSIERVLYEAARDKAASLRRQAEAETEKLAGSRSE